MVVVLYKLVRTAAEDAKQDGDWLLNIVEAHKEAHLEAWRTLEKCDPKYHRLVREQLQPKQRQLHQYPLLLLGQMNRVLGHLDDDSDNEAS